jgi:hypothetical protein
MGVIGSSLARVVSAIDHLGRDWFVRAYSSKKVRRGWMLLAYTVVPWTSEWLVFYELWLITGEWLGGGTHPAPRRAGRRSA